MQLRDKFRSLDDLVRYYDIDKQLLCNQLAEHHFFIIVKRVNLN
ncbi:DUF4250 family protein [Utexia brackfieldae]